MNSLFRLLLLSALFFTLSGCYERHEWRQKLTVVVETPTGEASAEVVSQVRVAYYGQLTASGTEVDYDITGEATAVKVSPGQYVFVLLDGNEELFYRSARDRFRGMNRQQWLPEIRRQEEPIIVPPDEFPLMVAFLDVTDPTSLHAINAENFAQVLGEGYSLKEMKLEITDQPVTHGKLANLLEWWPAMISGARNQMVPLRLPDSSPRGWVDLSSASFWSLDLRQEFSQTTE